MKARDLPTTTVVALRLDCKVLPHSFGELGRRYELNPETVARISRGELRPDAGGPLAGVDYVDFRKVRGVKLVEQMTRGTESKS